MSRRPNLEHSNPQLTEDISAEPTPKYNAGHHSQYHRRRSHDRNHASQPRPISPPSPSHASSSKPEATLSIRPVPSAGSSHYRRPGDESGDDEIDVIDNDANNLARAARIQIRESNPFRYPDAALHSRRTGYRHREKQMIVRIAQIVLAVPMTVAVFETPHNFGFRQDIDADLGNGRYRYKPQSASQQAMYWFLIFAVWWVAIQFVLLNIFSLYRLYRFRRNPNMEDDQGNFFVRFTGTRYLRALMLLTTLNMVFLFGVAFDVILLLGNGSRRVMWSGAGGRGWGIATCVLAVVMLALQGLLLWFIEIEIKNFKYLRRQYYG